MTSSPSETPVILAAKRTPIGKFQGALSSFTATELGAFAIKATLNELPDLDLASVDEVLMGNVVSSGLGQAPARQAAIKAGLPTSTCATTINKVCGSGLKTVMLASQAIKAGDGRLFIAGGMESMSRAPYLLPGRNGELRYGNVTLIDSLLNDGLWDPFENWGMGNAAEFIAGEYGISREEMDQYAHHSHQKAVKAMQNDAFVQEITSVSITDRKGAISIISTDEGPRADVSVENLAKLKPSFIKDGKVTAGNASTLNDGAAACIIASQQYAKENSLTPLARVVATAQVAVEPKFLFAAPAHAMPLVLKRSGWQLADVDLIELNEAFAAQVLSNGKALASTGWDWDKVNINGGGISLGHPLGASGTRVLVTLVHTLRQNNLRRGMACLCLGGGEAVAVTIEII